jgi:hypothetical protein
MKPLFTFPMLVTTAITGIVSCRLYYHSHYDLSALLTIASVVSIAAWVSLLKAKKISLQ